MHSSDSAVLPRVLLGVAAAAAAGLSASEASASVIVTEPTAITVAPLSYIYFDPQTGYVSSATPLEAAGVGAPFSLGFYAGNSSKPEIVTSTGTGFEPGQAFGNASGYAPEIGVSTTINMSTGTLEPVGTTTYLHYTTAGTTYPWVEGNHGFLAYTVPSAGLAGEAAAGTTLYGWAEVSYNTANTLTLYGFGYDNSGAAIATPAALVPEPGSLAAAATLGAAGLLGYRRRRAREQQGESSVAGAVAQA